jgi:twinkle protein
MQSRRTDSEFIRHEACEACGSSDGNAIYTDGHTFCFVCQRHTHGDKAKAKEVQEEEPDSEGDAFAALKAADHQERDGVLTIQGEAVALGKRRLREDTCALWNYRVGTFNGQAAQFAYYFDPATRKPVAAKVRLADKTFSFIGDAKSAPLYGQWLWRDGGRMVVITEGELDALSVSQLQGNKWPVVSIKNGAQGATKDIRRSLEWLEKFESVVFMFDNDEPGMEAARACAALLRPGRAKIATLPLKDASDMLQAGRGEEVINAIWAAKEYRPDGIVSASELRQAVLERIEESPRTYPWDGLNKKLLGIRPRELITITAGSGIGKSLFCREIAYPLLNNGDRIGYIALEENNRRTVQGFVGIGLNHPVHVDRGNLTDAQLNSEMDRWADRLFLYDSFGSIEIDNLLSRLRYLAIGCECEVLFLDHISIAISGLEIEDERKAIDVMMTKLRSLVEETGKTMFIVSHLKRPQGREGHEDGLQVSLSHLRGSAGIAQLSDAVIALERDQQGEASDVTTVRVLKNRYTGETGVACKVRYDRATGRLHETAETEF